MNGDKNNGDANNVVGTRRTYCCWGVCCNDAHEHVNCLEHSGAPVGVMQEEGCTCCYHSVVSCRGDELAIASEGGTDAP